MRKYLVKLKLRFGFAIKGRAGFTLIELMVATAILVSALVGLLGVFIACFNLNELTKGLTMSLNGIQVKMEEIRTLPFDSISSNAGPFDIKTMDNANSAGIVEVTAVNGSDALLMVTVTACWSQKSGRIIGEDSNLNGVFVPGTEDKNGNGKLDSPVQIVTMMARR